MLMLFPLVLVALSTNSVVTGNLSPANLRQLPFWFHPRQFRIRLVPCKPSSFPFPILDLFPLLVTGMSGNILRRIAVSCWEVRRTPSFTVTKDDGCTFCGTSNANWNPPLVSFTTNYIPRCDNDVVFGSMVGDWQGMEVNRNEIKKMVLIATNKILSRKMILVFIWCDKMITVPWLWILSKLNYKVKN